jgi:hypothetical protein
MGITVTHATQVPPFDNLSDDSSLDVQKTHSPAKAEEKHASPLPLVSGECLCFSFTLLLQALITALQMLPGFRPR